MIEPENFRLRLRERYAELSETNPRYSLRAFAKRTGLCASVLSRVINGKRSLPLETMLRVSQSLNLDLLPSSADKRKAEVIEAEAFKVIADWYHFPIIELIRTRGFKSDEHWIAKRLDLPLAIVQAALDRLEKLKLIERDHGQIRAVDRYVKTSDDVKSSAIRAHHRQMLKKADAALDENVDEREFQAINFSFERDDMPEAKKMIRDFCTRFNCRFSKEGGEDIYQLNLQLFKLTKGEP